eukprot:CAMPEP_0173287576 /NCGR_PEP_ID=MMETSP1143-20121109/9878_1 /TAXON_ID=483371 /ORGANISM="non described non described, Strain CCMP2298" /LENGTH=118 /DNA_ID=CAMNT_0014226125 /DNA_START=66 /DNA_END=422 /DNA_ORIENTATION=+
MDAQLAHIEKHRRPPMPALGMQMDDRWEKTHVTYAEEPAFSQHCGMNPDIVRADRGQCRFTHSWIDDDADPLSSQGLLTANQFVRLKTHTLVIQLLQWLMGLLGLVGLCVWYFLTPGV